MGHIGEVGGVLWDGGPVAEAEALVGSLTGHPRLVEKEKARELSVPSLSSVPSTILQRQNVCLGK